MCIVAVIVSWPEESAQSVTLGAWDNVHVQMRYALADTVVERHEGALAPECFADRRRQELCLNEERLDELGRKVVELTHVEAGHEQNMSREERPLVQKTEHMVVLKDDARRRISGDDPAESAWGDDRGIHGSSDTDRAS